MKIIFEDDKEDIISKFFMSAYPEEISKEFVYVKGNGNLVSAVEQCLETAQDPIVVFIDMIPDNIHTVDVYRKLRAKSLQNNNRVLVLPIMCSEYYLIMSLKNTDIMVESAGVDICIRKEWWRDSALISTQEDKEYCKNFEKYCKLILKKNLKYCASHSGKSNECYAAYYLNDCLCKFKDKDENNPCNQHEDRDTKVIRFLNQYPCIPSGSIAKNRKTMSVEGFWNLHRRLVSEFNEMVACYKKMDNSKTRKYKEIKTIC